VVINGITKYRARVRKRASRKPTDIRREELSRRARREDATEIYGRARCGNIVSDEGGGGGGGGGAGGPGTVDQGARGGGNFALSD